MRPQQGHADHRWRQFLPGRPGGGAGRLRRCRATPRHLRLPVWRRRRDGAGRATTDRCAARSGLDGTGNTRRLRPAAGRLASGCARLGGHDHLRQDRTGRDAGLVRGGQARSAGQLAQRCGVVVPGRGARRDAGKLARRRAARICPAGHRQRQRSAGRPGYRFPGADGNPAGTGRHAAPLRFRRAGRGTRCAAAAAAVPAQPAGGAGGTRSRSGYGRTGSHGGAGPAA